MADETKRRLVVPNKNKMRNLVQYKNMSDEEFDSMFSQKEFGISQDKGFEDRIEKKIEEFGIDYDLDDLNSNDRLTLRALAQAYISLEDYELFEYGLKKEGISEDTIVLLDKVNKFKTDLRTSISAMSGDLQITRKVRKSNKEQSLILYLEDLKRKAKEFYESKMQLIFCPKCNTWIGSLWVLYPELPQNKVTVVCNREIEDGTKCDGKITITTKELLEMGGSSKEDIPESIK